MPLDRSAGHLFPCEAHKLQSVRVRRHRTCSVKGRSLQAVHLASNMCDDSVCAADSSWSLSRLCAPNTPNGSSHDPASFIHMGAAAAKCVASRVCHRPSCHVSSTFLSLALCSSQCETAFQTDQSCSTFTLSGVTGCKAVCASSSSLSS